MKDGEFYALWVPENGDLKGAIVVPGESIELVDGPMLAKQVNDESALIWMEHGLEGFVPGKNTDANL